MDIATGLERYIRHHRAEGSTAKTQENHRLSIGQFIRHLRTSGHSGMVEDLCADDLRGFIDQLRDRGLTQSSVATKVRSVKAFGRWLEREEYVRRDPFGKVRQTKVDELVREALTPDEVDRLLATCDRKRVVGARDFALIVLAFSTGLRASEMLGLAVEDIDTDKQLIIIRRAKGGKVRMVPLSRPVEKALFKYLDHRQRSRFGQSGQLFLTDDGKPLDLNGLWKTLHKRGHHVGIRLYPHLMRHTAAITYLRGGGRLETLKAMLGHSTLTMSLHYARIAAIDLANAHITSDPVRTLKTRI